MTATTWPAWWASDQEHAPALLAFEYIRRSHHIYKVGDDDPDRGPGWTIDFEAAWAEPMSSGERILVAHAWCLYNLSWAAEVEAKASPEDGEPGFGPLFWSNPRRAIATLGGAYWQLYLGMIEVARGDLLPADARDYRLAESLVQLREMRDGTSDSDTFHECADAGCDCRVPDSPNNPWSGS